MRTNLNIRSKMNLTDPVIDADLISWIKYIGYILFVYLGIESEVFLILAIVMAVDSVTGVIRAVRLGEKISFTIFYGGVAIKFLFVLIPLLVALVGKGLQQDLTIGALVVMKIMVVSEAYSALGNIYSAKTKKKISNIDFISLLIHAIRNLFKSVILLLISKIEKNGEPVESDESLDEQDSEKS